MVSTGNINNLELEQLFATNLEAIADGFSSYDYVEINRANIIFHS